MNHPGEHPEDVPNHGWRHGLDAVDQVDGLLPIVPDPAGSGGDFTTPTDGDLLVGTTNPTGFYLKHKGAAGTVLSIVAGVVSWAFHNLLSATHADTVAGAPVAGGLVYANNTPKWDQLGAGTVNQVLTMAAGLPSWQTPAGTSVTFAYYFEAMLSSASGTCKARVWDITASAEVAGSQINTVSATPALVRSGAITPVTGHSLRAEWGGDVGGTYTIYSADLVEVPSSGPTAFISFGSVPVGGQTATP